MNPACSPAADGRAGSADPQANGDRRRAVDLGDDALVEPIEHRHVNGLRLRDIHLTTIKPEARPKPVLPLKTGAGAKPAKARRGRRPILTLAGPVMKPPAKAAKRATVKPQPRAKAKPAPKAKPKTKAKAKRK